MKKNYYAWVKNKLLLELQIQTKASKNGILGEFNERLKVAITAPPIDDKANEHLIKFLASYFSVPQKKVEIIKGHKSKYKSVLISDPKRNTEKFKN